MYRRRGDQDWFPSRVLNLSDSGVLFGPTELQLGTAVGIILTTPTQIAWFSPGERCARIVRATEGGAVAARFVGDRKCLEGDRAGLTRPLTFRCCSAELERFLADAKVHADVRRVVDQNLDVDARHHQPDDAFDLAPSWRAVQRVDGGCGSTISA